MALIYKICTSRNKVFLYAISHISHVFKSTESKSNLWFKEFNYMCTPNLSHFGFWTCSVVKYTVHILYDLKLASWTLYINALCICSILWGKTSFSHHTWGRVGTRVHNRMKTSWWRQFKALVNAMLGNLGFSLLQHIQYLNIVAKYTPSWKQYSQWQWPLSVG